MAELIEPILEQNFELIRDQIGFIIKTELAEQKVLQPGVSILDKDPRVFIDRLISPDKSELPMVNVLLDSGSFDNQDVEAVDGTYIYNIDVYNSAESGPNESRGDTKSLAELQRLMGIIRSIFQSVKYLRLGFEPPSIMHRSIKTIQISDPSKNEDGSNVSYGRLSLEVRVCETGEMFVPIPLVQSCTTVKLCDTDKGFEWCVNTTLFRFVQGCYQGDLIRWDVENEDDIKEYQIQFTTNGTDWSNWSAIPKGTPPAVPNGDDYNMIFGATFPFLSVRIQAIDNDDNVVYTSGAMPKREFMFDGIGYNSTTEVLSILADNSTGVIRYEAEVTLLNTTDTEIRGYVDANQANGGNYIIYVPQNNEWEFIRVRAILEGDVCVYSDSVNVPLDSGVIFDSVVGSQPTPCSFKIDWIVSQEDDIEKYEIYRNKPAPDTKIGEVLQGETYTFTDTDVYDGGVGYYVKAVGLYGGFELNSNSLLTIINCPEVYQDDVYEDDVYE